MKVLRTAKNAYIEANKRRNLGIVVLLLLLGEFFIVLGSRTSAWLLLLTLVPLMAVPIFLRRYDIWKAGAKGEKAVTWALQELNDSYSLVNSLVLPGRKGDIDHVILGPNGVFVIEAKFYSGDVVCDGDNWYRRKRRARNRVATGSFSKQAKGNASALRDFILETTRFHLRVHPILVFANPSARLQLNNPTIPVLQLGELARFIRNAEPAPFLSNRQLDALGKSICEASSK